MSVLLVAFGVCLLPSCTPPKKPLERPSASSPLPAGARWEGVYRSKRLGQLHLVEQADGAIRGAWRTTQQDAFGELLGKADGDVLGFDWSERTSFAAGGTTLVGEGYFVYRTHKAGGPDLLLGESVSGTEPQRAVWRARKWEDVLPDLWNVRPRVGDLEGVDEEEDGHEDLDDADEE